jgi:carboxyl-terminal processing protease
MPLDDAVARLRGKPGSKVTVWVHRDGTDGWAGSRPFELVREEIQIESVISKALAPGIAYVRIKQFQQSTEAELTRALEGVAGKDRLRGVVIDLRGNGGGLLDQAAKVADKFLDQGVIVSTVGAAEGREEKKASPHDTEPNYPLVVLVNGSAASASEIVAGALKNLDRAVIIGQTTFGKGTVQLVFPRVTPDGAALKLTIAQYLTPGDVSIQGVGVTPDIELDPMTVDTLEMDLYRSEESLRERDLSKSLSNGTKRQERPALTLRYNLPEKERAEWRERGGDLEDEFQLDFPIKFARDLVSKLPVGGRPEQVRAARAIVDKAQAAELATVATDLMGLGVDWSEPPKNAQGPKAGDYAVKLRTDRKGDAVTAGDPMTLEVTVENKGTAPIHQLRAVTKSDSGYYDEKELAFGKIDAGQSRTASVPLGWCETEGRKVGSTKPLPLDAKRVCRLPKDAVTRQDIVKVRFFAAGGEAPPEAEIRPTVTSLPQPAFAYAYYVMDDRPGNGDGQLARGEGATIHLIVKNIGKGRSHEDTQANLRNLTGDGVLLHAGRFDLSNLKPGEVKELDFTFDVLDRLSESFVKLEISVTDRDLRVGSSEKLSLPVIKGGTFVDKAGGRVGVRGASASVAGQPIGSARAFGELEKGAVVERLGKVGEFTKISLGGNRWGFVESKLLDETQAPLRFAFKPWLSRSPPLLDVKPAQLATTGDRVKIEASVTDADRVLDAYVFVGSNKVFYQSNRKSAEPTKLSFSHEALLKPGINVITVVARESEDVASRTTMVVRRDGPNGEALPTPKSDLFGADWEFGAESE